MAASSDGEGKGCTVYFEIPYTDASSRFALKETVRKGSRTNNLQNWFVRSAHDLEGQENDTVSEKNRNTQGNSAVSIPRDSPRIDLAASSDDSNSNLKKSDASNHSSKGAVAEVTVYSQQSLGNNDCVGPQNHHDRHNNRVYHATNGEDTATNVGISLMGCAHNVAAINSTNSSVVASEKNSQFSSLKQFNNFMKTAYGATKEDKADNRMINNSSGYTLPTNSGHESHTERCTSRDMNSSFNTPSGKSLDNSDGDRLFRPAAQRMSSVPELVSNINSVGFVSIDINREDDPAPPEEEGDNPAPSSCASWHIARVTSSKGSPMRPLTLHRQQSRKLMSNFDYYFSNPNKIILFNFAGRSVALFVLFINFFLLFIYFVNYLFLPINLLIDFAML